MDFSEKKSVMVYKNEQGGRISVKICLPHSEGDSELNSLYEALTCDYMNRAKRYIEQVGDSALYFFEVAFSVEEKQKKIKIKRLTTLKCGGKALFALSHTDVFDKDGLRLKK